MVKSRGSGVRPGVKILLLPLNYLKDNTSYLTLCYKSPPKLSGLKHQKSYLSSTVSVNQKFVRGLVMLLCHKDSS